MAKKKNENVEKSSEQSLLSRLMSVEGSIKAVIAAEDEILLKESFFDTGIPFLNVALSGDVYGGVTPGVTVIAGPSKHFKSLFCLNSAAQFQRDNPDGVILFYNNEFGVNAGYMKKAGVDINRVIHLPFTTIEDLRADMYSRLISLQKNDKVMLVTDSIGAGATMRELSNVEDATKQDDDRARAKAIKSLFRMVGPLLNIKGIAGLFVGHTRLEGTPGYETTVVSGGQGPYYFADNIIVVSRKAMKTKVKGEKGDADVGEEYNSNDHEYSITEGYQFLLHIDKGRFTQEGRVLMVEVRWATGVCKWGGFAEMSNGFGLVDEKRGAKNQVWYHFPSQNLLNSDPERYKDIIPIKSPKAEQVDENGEVVVDVAVDDKFWEFVLENSELKNLIYSTYRK